ncbi:MAG: 16S rRNA (cytosine(1402)-N(4))-methyltransferase RsmH [Candidatus Binataceae bacterium]|nr:16S rRNA (cytosine(1402)-N(4))-methyltransferase RsmH [Candidatus Binataceae bacterium]
MGSAAKKMTEWLHEPAMVAEVSELLLAHRPATIVDLTVGAGGHAEALLGRSHCDRLIGIDRDTQAIAAAAERLAGFGDRVILRQSNFDELDSVLDDLGIAQVDAILADLGMSSLALDDPARGFSFQLEGPLDMRMDRRESLSAADLVDQESEDGLTQIIREYGEERHARRVARAIVAARRGRKIETTYQLRSIIERALGSRRIGGVNPATRTFQALRIAVNHELESLATILDRGPARLAPAGRMAVLAYHSLEDRAVKVKFRTLAHRDGIGFLAITHKPMRPANAEVARNPRSRSARLRCIERGEPA